MTPRAPLSLWRKRSRTPGLARLGADKRGVIAVEFALFLPIVLILFAMMVVFSQGLAIKRKVTLTSRTITDAVAQQNGTVSATNLTCILGAAAAVMTPWDSSKLSMVVSEVLIDAGGNAKVIWSQKAFNGVARTVGSTIPASTFSAAFPANSYEILGEVEYDYYPLEIYPSPATTYPLSEGIYMAPRNSTNILLTTP